MSVNEEQISEAKGVGLKTSPTVIPRLQRPGTFRRHCVSSGPRSLPWQRQLVLVVGRTPKST